MNQKDEVLWEMGRRLAERRKQLRLTQDEVAERADLTPQTVSTAERGQKALRPENLLKLCKTLDISADYLLTGKINGTDLSILSHKTEELSESQFRNLEEIIVNFIQACKAGSKGEENHLTNEIND